LEPVGWPDHGECEALHIDLVEFNVGHVGK
jgi:hypothetical protein